MLERTESLLDTVTAEWCDAACHDSLDSLDGICSVLTSVQQLSLAGSTTDEASLRVVELLGCLDRFGSAVVQSLALLSNVSATARSQTAALETLRGLGKVLLEHAPAEEISAFDVVKQLLGPMDVDSGDLFTSACMALHTLGCRLGSPVCNTADLVELCGVLMTRTAEVPIISSATSAAYLLYSHLLHEAPSKSTADIRAAVDNLVAKAMRGPLQLLPKTFTPQCVVEQVSEVMATGALGVEDISLASGTAGFIQFAIYAQPSSLEDVEKSGIFSEGLTLLSRVMPRPLPSDWWIATCDIVDVTSVRLGCAWWLLYMTSKKVFLSPRPWQRPLLELAVSQAKLNAAANLSGRETMSFVPMLAAHVLIEAAANDPLQQAFLLEAGVMGALEYGCMHDFPRIGGSLSIATNSAGAAVALVGRNEGGHTLSRAAVVAIVEGLRKYFNTNGVHFETSPKVVLIALSRIATMAISDANKRLMLPCDDLIRVLCLALLLDQDNPRRAQDGVEALQEAAAGTLHELSLFAPWAQALRGDAEAMASLRELQQVGTKSARESAGAALFELDGHAQVLGDERAASNGTGTYAGLNGNGKQQYIMVSYNWDHQDVILRVVGTLQ
eukprot:COSAG06_NODE_7614_length_2439_cov_1.950855_1_plen_612_part_10